MKYGKIALIGVLGMALVGCESLGGTLDEGKAAERQALSEYHTAERKVDTLTEKSAKADEKAAQLNLDLEQAVIERDEAYQRLLDLLD